MTKTILTKHLSNLGVAIHLSVAAACLGTVASAQGVPVIDTSNLTQNVQQLQQALSDAENQIEQIVQLKTQIENQIESITQLEFLNGALAGLNDIADLYNDVPDLYDRAAKITDLSGFAFSLSIGDFDGILDNMLDGDVTMGDKRAVEAMTETLETAGFTSERLEALSSSDNPQDNIIADTAGVNATAIAASQLAYEEAAASLERVEGLVTEISNQETMKESVDLNTRMAAETNFMLGQMWRHNAAMGLAQGQQGMNWAAEQAKERAFFSYSGDE